jgi:hypothetical protein
VTRAYFSAGDWSTDFSTAEIFTDMPTIFRARDKYQITQAEVVLLMKEHPSDADVTMDLQPPFTLPKNEQTPKNDGIN